MWAFRRHGNWFWLGVCVCVCLCARTLVCVCVCSRSVQSSWKIRLLTAEGFVGRHDGKATRLKEQRGRRTETWTHKENSRKRQVLWQNYKCVWSDMIAGRVAGKVGWIWNAMSSHHLLDSRVRPSRMKNWAVNTLQSAESPQMRTHCVTKCNSVLEVCSSDLVNLAKKI